MTGMWAMLWCITVGNALDAEVTVEPGEGATISVQEGRFALTTQLRGQVRYTLEGPDDERARHGLTIPRARLDFEAHVWGKVNALNIQLAFSPNDLGLSSQGIEDAPLLDFYFQQTSLRDLSLRLGLHKVPFRRERLTSSGDLELVDRSLVNRELDINRDVGLTFYSSDLFGLNLLRYWVGIFNGEGRSPTELRSVGRDGGLMYVVRAELLPMGVFSAFSQGDLTYSHRPQLSLGAGYVFWHRAEQVRGRRGPDHAPGVWTNFQYATFDAMFKWAGFALTGEVTYRTGEPTTRLRQPPPPEDIPPVPVTVGTFLQASYTLQTVPLAVAARWSELVPLRNSWVPAIYREAGGGLTYYFAGHAFKVQLDVFRQWLAFNRGATTGRLQLEVGF